MLPIDYDGMGARVDRALEGAEVHRAPTIAEHEALAHDVVSDTDRSEP